MTILEAPAKVKKHMSHMYEDKSMTFAKMLKIFQLASRGSLKNVTEKFDGQNVSFTYDLSRNEIRFSRNKGHVLSGGMGIQDIEQKWASNEKVKGAFANAYKALSQVVGSFSKKTLLAIFGPNGNIWYSIEIIYSGNPNVIHYSENMNHIVLHKVAVIKNKNGEIEDFSGPEFAKRFGVLNAAVSSYEKNWSNVAKKMIGVGDNVNWKVHGPVAVKLSKAVDGGVYEQARASLENEIGKYGLSLTSSIERYLAKRYAEMFFTTVSLKKPVAVKAGELLASDSSVSEKKNKAVELGIPQEIISVYFKADLIPKLEKKLIAPIETIVHEFAVGMLNGVHSALILNTEKEIQRLSSEVQAQINKIEASGDEKSMAVLKSSLEKLKGLDRITSSLEGITFEYQGKVYKLTGNFAPINQILGLFRYS